MALTPRQLLTDAIYSLAKVLRKEVGEDNGNSLMLSLYVTVSGIQNLLEEASDEIYSLQDRLDSLKYLNDAVLQERENLRGRIRVLEEENYALRNPPSPAPIPGMSYRVRRLAVGLDKLEGFERSPQIAAIKVLRKENYLGLKEAKDRVEAWLKSEEASEMKGELEQNREATAAEHMANTQ